MIMMTSRKKKKKKRNLYKYRQQKVNLGAEVVGKTRLRKKEQNKKLKKKSVGSMRYSAVAPDCQD